MGGYEEQELDVTTRALTAFETPLGRMQLTRLAQKATNSVAVYQAQMTWILKEEIPESVGIFIDDGGTKGPRNTTRKPLNQKIFMGICHKLRKSLIQY
ncbi:hypothetical protein O181_121235 [Austropuccinia psidii MF-1]|uniref:Uncharacterized protein n=1 Tax=Austropuccinia psidii MF-1 TaxID=1389203 RepID=A0A9Q3KH73_9BASI|nr:hypothetical protein [Austropuccinia psidii MF-1]